MLWITDLHQVFGKQKPSSSRVHREHDSHTPEDKWTWPLSGEAIFGTLNVCPWRCATRRHERNQHGLATGLQYEQAQPTHRHQQARMKNGVIASTNLLCIEKVTALDNQLCRWDQPTATAVLGQQLYLYVWQSSIRWPHMRGFLWLTNH